MKETIYTIPVMEALEKESECPFCTLYDTLEQEFSEHTLGGAMMEPDHRIESNEKGYCKEHFELLIKKRQALPLALILETHLDSVIQKLSLPSAPAKKGLFGQSKGQEDPLLNAIAKVSTDCVICEKIKLHLSRYIDVFLTLWKKEQKVKEMVQNSKGFCLTHFAEVCMLSGKINTPVEHQDFLQAVLPIQKECLLALRDDVHKFTLQFDYRSDNSIEEKERLKQAIPTAIGKLVGTIDS